MTQPDTPVLSYAPPIRPITRELKQLAAIVCISQLLSVLDFVLVAWVLRDRLSLILANTTFVVWLILWPIANLLIAINTLILLVRGRCLRIILYVTIALLASCVGWVRGSNIVDMYKWTDPIRWSTEVLTNVSNIAVILFPSITLALLLSRRRRISLQPDPLIIWPTAVACLTFAAGPLGLWTLEFPKTWVEAYLGFTRFQTWQFGGPVASIGSLTRGSAAVALVAACAVMLIQARQFARITRIATLLLCVAALTTSGNVVLGHLLGLVGVEWGASQDYTGHNVAENARLFTWRSVQFATDLAAALTLAIVADLLSPPRATPALIPNTTNLSV